MQDVSVRMLSGFAGFGGGGGAGTSHINVAVYGGRFGVYFDKSEPCPLVGSARLINQTESAIVFSSQPTMIVVGVQIVQHPAATGPAIVVPASSSPISLVDVAISCGADNGTALQVASSLTAHNVYLSPSCRPGMHGRGWPDGGPSGGWVKVEELVRGTNFSSHDNTMVMDVAYVDGERHISHRVHKVMYWRKY